MNPYFDYDAESDTEELMLLVGRLEAFAGFVDCPGGAGTPTGA